MPQYVQLITYFLSFALGIVSFAACINSLVKRNHDFKQAENLAAGLGVDLHLSSSDLDDPSYALAAGAGIVAGFSLLLLISQIICPKKQLKGALVLLPIILLVGTLLVFGSAITVLRQARTGHLAIFASLHGFALPKDVIQEQAASLGLSLRYWDRSYVRFMAIAPWPLLPFALVASFFAFTESRPQSTSHTDTPVENGAGQVEGGATSDWPEKTSSETVV
ncbi:hypothetical protein BCR39DRAFT_588852 [Naematelia encephala]|uniref:Uncharacterized protein n=1 Tax=Naematelia encephala TaxID=71784 RepID=A0A1Y2B018_9TREE|nr:hypothetical protein BCR39DRAFT_588852 [Naematelia encephala]